jgi:hypothetical protein
MPAAKVHNWTFRSRFRAGAFGWRSDLPIKRIEEALAEIKKATRKDKVLGAEGAVIFLEKVSGALEYVDSSSGAIGTAINRAIETLVPIVAQAAASDNLRDKWLERLWFAIEDDDIPYIELLAEHWANCASRPSAPRGGRITLSRACDWCGARTCHVEATLRAPRPA